MEVVEAIRAPLGPRLPARPVERPVLERPLLEALVDQAANPKGSYAAEARSIA